MHKKDVTPPGMENVVQALKKKPEIENPWAVAWSMVKDEDCDDGTAHTYGQKAGTPAEDTASLAAAKAYGPDVMEDAKKAMGLDTGFPVEKEGAPYMDARKSLQMNRARHYSK